MFIMLSSFATFLKCSYKVLLLIIALFIYTRTLKFKARKLTVCTITFYGAVKPYGNEHEKAAIQERDVSNPPK